MAEHNAEWNPSGVPHRSDVKRPAESGAEGATPAKKAKVLEAEKDGPQTVEELASQHGKLVEVPVGSAKLFFDKNGAVWALASDAECELNDDGPPLALVFGTFKLGEDSCDFVFVLLLLC